MLILFWSLFYIAKYKRSLFYITVIIFVCSILLLTRRERLLIVFLGWEGLGITSFLLIVFYQNWIRSKGGLLTLLTNRLGDAIFLIVFCKILLSNIGYLEKNRTLIIILIIMVFTLTKRAQWPFIRWLPAAIAAPTPVRSLVHSSTLVTAGVWLIIRFGYTHLFTTFFWGGLGTLTLLVARLSALIETDAKKIVALSTLRQLGLIFIALAIGIPIICFFHIIIHAFAKACLFIIIGNLLFSRFSQQDSRIINSRITNSFTILSLRISLFRLIGLTFTSGFFSKEQILIGHHFLVNSLIFSLLIILIVSLTMSYCIKLFISIILVNPERLFQNKFTRFNQLFPIFIIRVIIITLGYVYISNLYPCFLLLMRPQRVYWVLSVFGLVFLRIRALGLVYYYRGFFLQSKMIDLIISTLKRTKPITSSLESSQREALILISRFFLTKTLYQGLRRVFLFSLLVTVFFLI